MEEVSNSNRMREDWPRHILHYSQSKADVGSEEIYIS